MEDLFRRMDAVEVEVDAVADVTPRRRWRVFGPHAAVLQLTRLQQTARGVRVEGAECTQFKIAS